MPSAWDYSHLNYDSTSGPAPTIGSNIRRAVSAFRNARTQTVAQGGPSPARILITNLINPQNRWPQGFGGASGGMSTRPHLNAADNRAAIRDLV